MAENTHQFTNNALGTVQNSPSLSSGGTNLIVNSSLDTKLSPLLFPFYLTLWAAALTPDNDPLMEVVEVSARPSPNNYTIVRAKQGTTGVAHALNDNCALLLTAGNFTELIANLQNSAYIYSAGGGSANTQTVTLDPVPAAYTTGLLVIFKAAATNTSTTTLNVNGLGAKTIKKIDGATNLAAGDILVGTTVAVIYDGTNFQMVSTLGNIGISQNGSEIFGVDSSGTDAYAITLVPAPTAYTTGMVVNFTAGTLNTGAATLNVNGLGAKSLVRNFNVALVTGDILAGQAITAIYDGTNFQMQSPVTRIIGSTNGTFSAQAAGTQTITHGLGRTPTIIRLHGIGDTTGTSNYSVSHGIYSNGGQSCVYISAQGNSSAASSNSFSIYLETAISGNNETGVVGNLTSTTFDIVWTVPGGGPTGRGLWEAQ